MAGWLAAEGFPIIVKDVHIFEVSVVFYVRQGFDTLKTGPWGADGVFSQEKRRGPARQPHGGL